MKKALLALLALLVIAAVVIGFAVRRLKPSAAAVDLETVEPRAIVETIKASGQVDARLKVNLSSQLIAKIQKIYVREGDEVRAGQPFLELEKEAVTAQRNEIASRLVNARNEVQRVRVELADAERRMERARALFAEGVSSREALDASELAASSATLRLESATEAVRQAEAALAKADDDLAKTTIYAPLSGRVVSLTAEEGEVVVSGTMNNAASVIAKIADLSELLAEVEIDETEIARVEVGQEATLTVDALSDRIFKGRVSEVGNSGYKQAGQQNVTFFKVRVLFEVPDPQLRPGMSVRADIRTRQAPNALAVPIQAVLQRAPVESEAGSAASAKPSGGRNEDEISVVFVYSDGKAVQKRVETGLADETHVEIVRGLEPGERVLIGPYRTLKSVENGAAVSERSKAVRDRDKKSSDGPDEERES